MSEIFKSKIYPKFFRGLKEKKNIDEATFFNSNFDDTIDYDYYEINSNDKGKECICGKVIYNINVLYSDILKVQIIMGDDCYANFLEDKNILNNACVKKCLLCNSATIGNNHQICNDCQKRKKCIKCKTHTPKKNYKVCIFCEYKQKPLNDGIQILGKYGKYPIYIQYGKNGPFLEWLKITESIPKYNIKMGNIPLENAIKLIKSKQEKIKQQKLALLE